MYKNFFDDLLKKLQKKEEKICVIGLGYVGLPLAVAFARKFKVVGFDINEERISYLKKGVDITKEVSEEDLVSVKENLEFTSKEEKIKECRVIIVAVPTPIDKLKDPDLSFIKKASVMIGRNLCAGTIIVYESTVWPGLTEEVCVPILEKESGLKWKKDFFVGYSPERVNPGDKKHTLEKIVKVVAGDTKETAEFLGTLYGTIISAGVYLAPDIKTAEAAKVIENIQRDLNIALMNELSIIFHRLGIDTKEVLKTASTKWNFLNFEPGLVGGHCIGVDPYYLAYKARMSGYIPQLILAGRSINESIPKFIAYETLKLLIKAGKKIPETEILVLGFSFKENVPDVRNTKVYDLIKELEELGIKITVYDPIADRDTALKEYQVVVQKDLPNGSFDAVIVAVKHSFFIEKFDLLELKKLCKNPYILIDIKGIYDKKEALKQGFIYWRL